MLCCETRVDGTKGEEIPELSSHYTTRSLAQTAAEVNGFKIKKIRSGSELI